MLQVKPQPLHVIKNKWLAKLKDLVDHQYFDAFIFFCLILNAVILACKWYNMDPETSRIIEMLNLTFLIIFIFECCFKVLVFRSFYFDSNWNRLDFFTVAISTFGLFFEIFLLDS